MTNTAPSTPDNGPRRFALNRSFTVPTKLTSARQTPSTPEIGAAEGIETLYTHPNANIIKFSTSGPGSRPSSSSAQSPRTPGTPDQQQGTLPWASATERTMAAGPMEIYRVPGSVSFLHSGALLHAIMPRSQCWCVDGVSKFAFRVLPDTYYRIELPGRTAEDLEQVEALKVTLAKVLFYERTACPFARTFTVELPDSPVDRRKGRKGTHGPAKRWKLARAHTWRPEDGEEPPTEEGAGRDSLEGSSEDVSDDDDREDGTSEDEENELVDEVKELGFHTRSRPRPLVASYRSVTAPPQMLSQSLLAMEEDKISGNDGSNDVVVQKPCDAEIETADPPTLRTFQAIPTDMPPSPPDSSAGIERNEGTLRESDFGFSLPAGALMGQKEVDDSSPSHPHQLVAEAAVDLSATTPLVNQDHGMIVSDDGEDEGDNSVIISRPAEEATLDERQAVSGAEDMQQDEMPRPPDTDQDLTVAVDEPVPHTQPEDPYAAIQARILARRSISGTPYSQRSSPASSSSSTATAGSAVSRRGDTTAHQQVLASALVQKAYTAVIGPPANLVLIMLKIAARITKGAFGSFIVQSPAGSKHVPGSFNLESIDADDFVDDDLTTEEDDFGVPLRSPVRLAAIRSSLQGDGDVVKRKVRQER